MPDVCTIDSLPDSVRRAVLDPMYGTRTVCPVCGGGSTRESSLSIRGSEDTPGLIKLSCWRATCGYWAYVVTGKDVQWSGRQRKEPRIFDRDTIPLQGEVLSMLVRDFGLRERTMNDHGWRLLRGDVTTLVLPVLDRNGQQIGTQTRTFETPKRVDSFKETARPFLDFWNAGSADPCVIVEDCLSACRLAGLGINAVALLGTNMSNADAKEISRFSQRCYLALDQDAWGKSLKLANRHAHVLTTSPIPLTLDIKNIEDDDDIRRLFGVTRRNADSGSDKSG